MKNVEKVIDKDMGVQDGNERLRRNFNAED